MKYNRWPWKKHISAVRTLTALCVLHYPFRILGPIDLWPRTICPFCKWEENPGSPVGRLFMEWFFHKECFRIRVYQETNPGNPVIYLKMVTWLRGKAPAGIHQFLGDLLWQNSSYLGIVAWDSQSRIHHQLIPKHHQATLEFEGQFPIEFPTVS